MEQNVSIIIDSSDEECPPRKRSKIEILKLPEIAQTFHFQDLQIKGIESQNDDDIVCLDDDDPEPVKTEINISAENVILPEKLEETEKDEIIIQTNPFNDDKSDGSKNLDTIKISKETSVNEIQDDIVCLDEDEPISSEINGHCNTPTQIVTKRIELTTVKENICWTRSDEPYKKYEDDNILFRENNINEIQSTSKDEKHKKDNLFRENDENETQSSSKDETLSVVLSDEFKAFLEACSTTNCDTKYKELILNKISCIKRKYNDADEKYIQSEEFKKLCITKTEKVQQKPKNSIINFNEVYRELVAKKKQKIDLTDQEKRYLKKLYSTLRKVYKKIKKLENEEVDFEEDNNSSYIMLNRYQERLCVIKKKICSYTKENFYSGSYLFRNLDLSSSKYSEINRAVDKLYNKKKQFPSFYEVNQCIRKCVKNNNINLTEEALTKEIQSVFNAMGSILQRRRKMELYESLSYFLDGAETDPADQDPEFSAILEKRQEENEKKIDEVLQKFSDCQERGEEAPLSSDSDDSNHVSDNSDDS